MKAIKIINTVGADRGSAYLRISPSSGPIVIEVNGYLSTEEVRTIEKMVQGWEGNSPAYAHEAVGGGRGRRGMICGQNAVIFDAVWSLAHGEELVDVYQLPAVRELLGK